MRGETEYQSIAPTRKAPKMSLTLAVAAIVFADLALIGVLAFVMSRAKLLTPHVPGAPAIAPQQPATRQLRTRRHAAPARSAALASRA